VSGPGVGLPGRPALDPCKDCRKIHQRVSYPGIQTCTAHRRGIRPLEPCLQWKISGLSICKNHGLTQEARAVGAQRVKDGKARELAERHRTFGVEEDIDAPTLILRELRWSAAHMTWLRGIIQEMDPDALIRGTRGISRTETVTTGFQPQQSTSTTSEAGPDIHIWLDLYYRERKLGTDLAAKAAALGLEAARIQLEQAQGARIAESYQWVLSGIAAVAELSKPQTEAVRALFVQSLEILAGDMPFPPLRLTGRT
jgi:hypothetical protein